MRALRALTFVAFAVAFQSAAATRVISSIVGGGPNNLPALKANVPSPSTVIADSQGNYYLASVFENRVYKVNSAGILTLVAGSGLAGFDSDTPMRAVNANLNYPRAIALDIQGNLLIVDSNNNRIRKVDLQTGIISTIAGSGPVGFGNGGFSGNGGPAISARLNWPGGIVVHPSGDIYISDTYNHQIRVIRGQNIQFVAGDRGTLTTAPTAGDTVPMNGDPTSARLRFPAGLTIDPAGRIYIADTYNHRILQYTSGAAPFMSFFVNNSIPPAAGDDVDGPALTAKLNYPEQIAFDKATNTLYIADPPTNRVKRIRNINSAGTPTIGPFIGTGVAGENDGTNNGIATNSRLYDPRGVCVQETTGMILVADTFNSTVRRVTQDNQQTRIAGNGQYKFSGDKYPAASAAFSTIHSIARDKGGNLFVTDGDNHRIRRIDAQTGIVDTMAGTGKAETTGEGQPAIFAALNHPWGLAFNSTGDLFVSEYAGNVIRMIKAGPGGLITPTSVTNESTIHKVAGNSGGFAPPCCFDGDGNSPNLAYVRGPKGIVIRSSSLWVAESGAHRVRHINLSPGGLITTVAGIPSLTFDPTRVASNVRGTESSVDPVALALDSSNNLIIAEEQTNRVRMLTPLGLIQNLIGAGPSNQVGIRGLAVAGSQAINAPVNDPTGVAVDSRGQVCFSDRGNAVIKCRDPLDQTIKDVIGTTKDMNQVEQGLAGDGGDAMNAKLISPGELVSDPGTGDLYVVDDARIRLLQERVEITIQSVPSGLSLVADNEPFQAPKTFAWTPGSKHTLSLLTTQNDPSVSGSRFMFANWSNGGFATQEYLVSDPATVTATFNRQYLLIRNTAPAGSGDVIATPASPDGFYSSGVSVQLNATPLSGYAFANFSGALNGSTNPQTIVMSSQRIVTATFQKPSTGGAIPTLGTVDPSSASGSSQTFTATFTMPSTGKAYFLMNTAILGSAACMIEYDMAGNGLRLIADSGVSWLEPMVPNGPALVNSQCSLSAATASLTGQTLTVTLPITFTPSFTGTKNVYLNAETSTGSTGFQLKGTYTVGASVPQGIGLVSFSPLSGSGASGTYTGAFTHSGGIGSLYLGYILLLPTPNVVQFTAAGSCMVEYNRISNGMRLINDAGDNWLGPLPGVVISPTAPPLENSRCRLNVAQSTAVLSGNTMTVNANVVIKSTMAGKLGTFLQGFDVTGGYTDMRQFGNWIAPGTNTTPGPYIVGLSPTSGAGSSATFTFTAGHTGGVGQLGMAHLLIASKIVNGNPCHVAYFPGVNTVNLVNDDGSGLVAAGVGPTLGTGQAISNSRCSVNPRNALRTTAGPNVIVSLPMTFNASTFGGAKTVYLNAFDNFGLLSHWVTSGSWTVQ